MQAGDFTVHRRQRRKRSVSRRCRLERKSVKRQQRTVQQKRQRKPQRQGRLVLPSSCEGLRNSYAWAQYRDGLYKKEWCPYIKETFNGFGNAIEYLGRYTHRIAITNSRIISVSSRKISFWSKNYRINKKIIVDISPDEFIRRLMMHVLPDGFQKIRYYGFLNNRNKKKNLSIIFRIQGHQKFTSKFTGVAVTEIMKSVWNYDISICPCCGKRSMRHAGRTFAVLN